MISLSTIAQRGAPTIQFTTGSTEKRGAGYYEDREQAKRKKEEQDKLRALGDLRAEDIIAKGTSKVEQAKARIEEIKQEQQRALSMYDSEAYDELAKELQGLKEIVASEPQTQISAAEAKADPFGKVQMSREQMDLQKQKEKAIADPRVKELMMIQKEARLNGQRLITDYLNATDEEQESKIRDKYFDLQKQSDLASSELGSNPALSGYHQTSMPDFYGQISKAVGGLSVQELKDLELRKKQYEVDKAKADVGNIGTDTEIKIEQLKQSRENTKEKQQGSQTERQNAGFVQRMIDADKVLSRTKPTIGSNMKAKFGAFTGLFDDAYSVNASEFITPNLRDESGAVISADEFKNAESRLVPKPNDDDKTLAFKAKNRANIINAGIRASGNAWKGGAYSSPFTGQVGTTIDAPKSESSDKVMSLREKYAQRRGK